MADRIRIILIDDNVEDSAIIATTAQRHTMIVTPFTDGKSAFKELRDQPPHYYQALIFDARCIWDTSVETKENDLFLGRAITELERIEKEYHTHYPMVVYTGFSAEFLPLKELVEARNGKIFTKSSTEPQNLDNLFKFLRQRVENLEEWVYRDVFEIFDRYNFMPPNPIDFRQKLKTMLKNIDDSAQGLSILQDVRVIQDEIYKILKVKCQIPDNVIKDGKSKNASFQDKNKHLSGNEINYKPTTTVYQTPVLSYLASTINQISSSFGNHSTSSPANINVKYWEQPSQYAVKSVVFALLEQLLWFKKLMQTP